MSMALTADQPSPPSLDAKSPPIQKTSLGFICSPTSSASNDLPPAQNLSANTARPVPSKGKRSKPLAPLESLPRNVLSQIALHLVLRDPAQTRRSGRKHPSALIPFFLTSRTIYSAVSFDDNPQLYNSLFRGTFDTSALERRYDWMVKNLSQQAGRGRKIFDLFSDPRSWAIDYKTRWAQTSRMRRVAKSGQLEGICEKEQLVADLWVVWFLLTENDGRNIYFLANECDFQRWITVYYREDMLKESLLPGYPKETGEKALAAWCALISGADLAAETTPAEVDEKIFVLRPYVFACAQYDVTYAPWHHRKLPLCAPGCADHEPDATLKSKALPYKRFGYTWRRAPPHFVLGIYLIFLRLLERQPGRMGLKAGSSTFAGTTGAGQVPGLFSVTRILPSVYHDREWQRNSVCQDPHTSPGLPPLTFRGEIEGFWRSKFLFYDFEMYRQILAGNIRGVYTGTFAEQAAEFDLKETVIKVRKEEVGGKGPLLCAGFDAEGEDYDHEAEQVRIREGYGYELVEDESAPDEAGWTKEILVSGFCRTPWGDMSVRGRIRAWDGLVNLAIAYKTTNMGRWLWRGYLHTGGHLVGRWRDTFTPEHLRGYEGAFGMIRAGDIFYPPSYPTRLLDSMGLDQNGGSPQPGAIVSYPPQNLITQNYPTPQPTPGPIMAPGPATASNGHGSGQGSVVTSRSASTSPANGPAVPRASSSHDAGSSSSRSANAPTWRTEPISSRQPESSVRHER